MQGIAPVMGMEEPTSWFKNDWTVYQKVLDGNFLEHKCMYGSAGDLIMQERLAKGRPLKLLDLGCGDADYICRTFQSLSNSNDKCHPLLESYTGVDLAQPALDIARSYLQKALDASTALQLDLDDMLSWVKQDRPGCSFDVIMLSFALHHLTAQDKLQVLSYARQLLCSPGGMLLLIDVFRNPTESHDEYMARFVNDIDMTWSSLDATEKQIPRSHATAFDIPESVLSMQEISVKAGFGSMKVTQEGQKGISKLVVFS